jgi:hypothetical protein
VGSLALAQSRHPPPQLFERDELLLVSLDHRALAVSRELAVEAVAAVCSVAV